jgi:peroxiredoxin Q/BCP
MLLVLLGGEFSMVLEAGDEAPVVSAKNQDGESVEVKYDSPTVLYFYPADDTPGCTTEAEQFQKESDVYDEAGVDLYGVSLDTVESHKKFAEKYDLKFDLLADPDAEIAEEFGVSVNQGTASRVTFVIVDGHVHEIYETVSPDGHARDVLMQLLDDGIVSLQ